MSDGRALELICGDYLGGPGKTDSESWMQDEQPEKATE